MVTFEHMLEHLLVLGDEEVVSSLQMRNDFLSERLCLAEVGLALIETGTFDGTRRDIEDAVRRAGFLQLHVHALNEYPKGCLSGAVKREEGRRHVSGYTHHHAATELFVRKQFVVEMLDYTDNRHGVHVEIGADHRLRDVLKEGEPSETGGDHQAVNVSEAVEKRIILAGEVKLKTLNFLLLVFVSQRRFILFVLIISHGKNPSALFLWSKFFDY